MQGHLPRLSGEHRDVLTGAGVDAFEGAAVGVEVPEVAGHSAGATDYRVPGGGQVSENAPIQLLKDALLSLACKGLDGPHPGCATSRCKVVAEGRKAPIQMVFPQTLKEAMTRLMG